MKSRKSLRAVCVVEMLLLILTTGCAGVSETTRPAQEAHEPPLDLATLESRLLETRSIGAFTRFVLRNEAGDLLNRFRAHHLDGRSSSVTALRQPYNMLILKVLALVQDNDPPLARYISGSREAIWNILADPKTFNALT